MKQTILAISGKPGLYKLVSRATNSLIVEALDDTHKRMPAFGTDRITSLADIAMFTETDDVPLMNVLAAMRDLEKGKLCSINFKKATPDELHTYFSKVLPKWDQDRVQNSHIKKLIQWYDILIKAGITDFEEEMAPTEGDNIDDRKEVKEEQEVKEWQPFILFLDDGFLWIDEGKEQRTDEQHDRYHVQWHVVIARPLYQFAKQDTTAEATNISCGIHRSAQRSCLLLAQVNTQGPSRRQHKVEDAEAQKTAILPGMKAARNIQTAETASELEPNALRPTLMP